LTCRFVHLGEGVDYDAARELQRRWIDARARDEVPDLVLLLEHAPTITVGRARGAVQNVVAPRGVPVVEVERGGDVTWHGPGQLVAYPLVKLEGERRDLHRHLRALEQAVMNALATAGLRATRDPRNTGVWLPGEPTPKKVCSVGIACRRWVTWHGLALNVDPELSAFDQIRPCGFDPAVMTRVADHLSDCPPARRWVEPVARALASELALEAGDVEAASVGDLLAALPG
jgi:lipoate-protein ligase B